MDERLAESVSNAAKLLGIGRGSAYEAIKRGQLPALKIGRRLIVPRKALEKMLESSTLNLSKK